VVVHVLSRSVSVRSPVRYVVLDGVWFDDVSREGRVLGLDALRVLVAETFESVAKTGSVGVTADSALAVTVLVLLRHLNERCSL